MQKTKVNNVAEQRCAGFSESRMLQLIYYVYKLPSVVTLRQMVHAQRGAKVA